MEGGRNSYYIPQELSAQDALVPCWSIDDIKLLLGANGDSFLVLDGYRQCDLPFKSH